MSDIVTNKTGEYLKFHADMEHDAGLPPARVETFLDVMIEIAAHGGFSNIKFHPAMTLAEVGEVCKKLSTDTHAVEARANWISGKLVVALHSVPRPQGLEALLEAGSEAPLSSLLRRQAD
jgi:hypothetical protein